VVVGRSPNALPHVHKQAGVRLHHYLGLEGVSLLLTTIMLSLLLWVGGALHSLFKGVYQGSELGHLGKHLLKGPSVLTTGVNPAHLLCAGLGEEGHKTMHQARDCRVTHPKQEAKHLMGRVDTQPYEAQEELVTHRQTEGVPSAGSTLTLGRRAGILMALLFFPGIQWEQFIEKGGKLRQFQACDGQKHPGIPL